MSTATTVSMLFTGSFPTCCLPEIGVAGWVVWQDKMATFQMMLPTVCVCCIANYLNKCAMRLMVCQIKKFTHHKLHYVTDKSYKVWSLRKSLLLQTQQCLE